MYVVYACTAVHGCTNLKKSQYGTAHTSMHTSKIPKYRTIPTSTVGATVRLVHRLRRALWSLLSTKFSTAVLEYTPNKDTKV